LAKNCYTGLPTKAKPFELSENKVVREKSHTGSEVILDVEITVPQGREARIQIHKGDSI
jgi:hypothetical protein